MGISEALFSCCTSNKAGVGILFNNNFTFQILKTYIDPLGRFLICDIRTNGIYLQLLTYMLQMMTTSRFSQFFFIT